MNLVDLRLPKKTKKELKEEMTAPSLSKQEKYPWGFRITLNTDLMGKFPQLKNAKVGEKVTVQGVGEVMEIRKVDRQGDKSEFSLEVQIQKIGMKTNMAHKEGGLIEDIERSKKGSLK